VEASRQDFPDPQVTRSGQPSFATYVTDNRALIPDDGAPYRQG
jgi:hypothetical protein